MCAILFSVPGVFATGKLLHSPSLLAKVIKADKLPAVRVVQGGLERVYASWEPDPDSVGWYGMHLWSAHQ